MADIVTAIRSQARRSSGLSAPEFDLSLRVADGVALGHMNAAAHVLANAGHDGDAPETRAARADRLWTEVWPRIETMIATAKATPFTGWSTAARAAGVPVRYAR